MREEMRKILMALYSVGSANRKTLSNVPYATYLLYVKILRELGCIESEYGELKPGRSFMKCLDLFGVAEEKRSRGGVVHVLLGDIHVGRRTYSYNYNIAKSQMARLVARVRALKDEGYRIIVLGLGDYVDGTGIYGRQEYEQEFDPNQQVIKFVELANPLVEISDGMYGIVGNHGRTDESEKGSYDYLALESLRVAHGKKVVASSRYVDIFDVEGERVLLAHLKFRSQYGIPDYSIRRFVQSQVISHRDLKSIYIGHYHTSKHWIDGGVLVVLNGTFLGGDELSYQYGLNPSISQTIIIKSDGKITIEVLKLE